jgi:DNA mismatch repair protein MutS
MMQQYVRIRQQYADCMLFFRLGDFYELFLEDALEGAKILGITLTRRPRGKDGDIPMAGVPFHSADTYIAKLLRAGKKIAICEQVSQPDNKGIVERKVIRIITPGTVLDDRSLEQKKHNYLASIEVTKKFIAVALADLLTGDFHVTQVERGSDEREKLGSHLLRFTPSECVVSLEVYNSPELLGLITHHHQTAVSYLPSDAQSEQTSDVFLAEQFSVASVRSFGFGHLPAAITAAKLLLEYINHTQQTDVKHLRQPKLFVSEEYVVLDPSTAANLELFTTIHDTNPQGSLIRCVDKTQTAAGGRLLQFWLLHPQKKQEVIENRYAVIEVLLQQRDTRTELQSQLSYMLDIERLTSKLALGIGTIASVLNIHQSLKIFLRLYPVISKFEQKIFKDWQDLPVTQIKKLVQRIEATVSEQIAENGEVIRIINNGVDQELDQLRSVITTGEAWINAFEQSERQRTGINTLKCRFNSVFGYYIEVSQSNIKSIPDNYKRKQTLVNAERFITLELKEHEEKILLAQERIAEIEREILTQLIETVVAHLGELREIARALAELDVLCSFAQIAQERRYCRPTITTNNRIEIIAGKHPVLAEKLHEQFVPNDVVLNDTEQQLLVITGPNMAGKSVFMRQTALLVLLAQSGSFIPAQSASISLVDRVFVRSGASDNISKGLSTFMVEMVDAAAILHQATSKSLVIMDEIGRGTSTYDGISIAWAIAEYLVTQPKERPKVLFATHYHELQQLEQRFPKSIKNFQVLVEEHQGKPEFLYTVGRGAASHSFGIAVARLAGLPTKVLENAQKLLETLETSNATEFSNGKNVIIKQEYTNNFQSELAELRKVKEQLSQITIATTTPLQALNLLEALQRQVERICAEN